MQQILSQIACAMSFLSVTQTFASGLYLYEVGTKVVGLAGAGQAAPEWRLNSGIAYDSSFYKNQNDTSITMPSGDAFAVMVVIAVNNLSFIQILLC